MYMTKAEFIKAASSFPLTAIPKDGTFINAAIFLQRVAAELMSQNNPDLPAWLIKDCISDIYARPNSAILRAIVKNNKTGKCADAVELLKASILDVKSEYVAEREKAKVRVKAQHITSGRLDGDADVELVVYDVPGNMSFNSLGNLPKLKRVIITSVVTDIEAGAFYNCPELACVDLMSAYTNVRDPNVRPIVKTVNSTAPVDSGRVKELEAEIAKLKESQVPDQTEELASLRAQLDTAQKIAASMESKFQECEASAARAQEEAEHYKTDLEVAKHSSDDLSTRLSEKSAELEVLKSRLKQTEEKLTEALMNSQPITANEVEKAVETVKDAATKGAVPTSKLAEIDTAITAGKKKRKPIDQIREILAKHGIDVSKEATIIDNCWNSLPELVRKYSKNQTKTVAESLEHYLTTHEEPKVDLRSAIKEKYSCDDVAVDGYIGELRVKLAFLDVPGETEEERMLFLLKNT